MGTKLTKGKSVMEEFAIITQGDIHQIWHKDKKVGSTYNIEKANEILVLLYTYAPKIVLISIPSLKWGVICKYKIGDYLLDTLHDAHIVKSILGK